VLPYIFQWIYQSTERTKIFLPSTGPQWKSEHGPVRESCKLQLALASTAILGSESRDSQTHILLYHDHWEQKHCTYTLNIQLTQTTLARKLYHLLLGGALSNFEYWYPSDHV
jgi:hypothetical protein